MDFDFDNLNLDDLKNEYNNPVSLEVQKLTSIINELSKEMNTYFKTNQFEKGEKAFDKLSSVVMRSQEAFTSCDLVVDDSNDYYSRYGEKLELDESSSEDKKIINVNDYIDVLKNVEEYAMSSSFEDLREMNEQDNTSSDTSDTESSTYGDWE